MPAKLTSAGLWPWLQRLPLTATDRWIVALAVFATVLVCMWAWRQDISAHHMQAEQRADSVQRQVNGELARVTDLLAANAAFASVTFDLSAASFAAFNQSTLPRHAALTQLQWLEWVPDTERFRFEFVTSRELGRPFEIRSPVEGKGLATAPTADSYLVVKGGVVQSGYRLSEGLNVLFTPERRGLYLDAIANAKTLVSNVRQVVTSKISAQGPQDVVEPGIIVSSPMYWYDMRTAESAERLGFIRGFITLLIQPQWLLRDTVVPLVSPGAMVYLVQEERGASKAVASIDALGHVQVRVEGLDFLELEGDIVRPVRLLDRQWNLVWRAAPAGHDSTFRWLQLGATGLVATLSLAYALMRRTANLRRRESLHQQAIVAKELAAQNAELERRVAERTQDLSAANQRLAQAQKELVRAERLGSLGTMVAGVAHELNTPLGNGLMAVTTLQSQLQVVSQSLASGAIKRSSLEEFFAMATEGIALADASLRRASTLVADFKEIAVPAARPRVQAVNLAGLIEEALASSVWMAQRDRITCDVQCAPDLRINTSVFHLQKTLMALFANVVHHAFEPNACGHMVVQALRRSDGCVELKVQDDGRGIAEDALPRLFDPFFTTRMGPQHRGLGLHQAYALVKLTLLGDIAVHSVEGGGAIFTITLPDLPPT